MFFLTSEENMRYFKVEVDGDSVVICALSWDEARSVVYDLFGYIPDELLTHNEIDAAEVDEMEEVGTTDGWKTITEISAQPEENDES